MNVMRRYDIDWIRVIAIGLLIIYHSSIAFQPWGSMIGFITNKESWPALWMPMAVLNVWRIPLLFFVSGMGVRFAMRSRTSLELIGERTRRIFIPYLFGMLVIVPIQISLWRGKLIYDFNPAHLWFLGNIMAYVVIFALPFYYLKNTSMPKLAGILVFAAALVAEVLIVNPVPYEMYAMTLHGFLLGMIAFFFGYMFFAPLAINIWIPFAAAISLAALRLTIHSYDWLIPIETVSWIIFIVAAGNKYLNKENRTLKYLSAAAYPVYIVHMIFQNLVSLLIFPLSLPVQIKFVLLVILTLGGCLLTYEVIKRTKVTRFLFGLKIADRSTQSPGNATAGIKPSLP